MINISSQHRAQDINDLFDKIAAKYDFLNHLLSGGLDYWWRYQLVKSAPPTNTGLVLDLCTGTADLAILYAKIYKCEVQGFDFSQAMLDIGREKVRKKGLTKKITLESGDVLNLPLADNIAEVVSMAFGMRNLVSIEGSIKEMYRLLKPGGTMAIIEFSRPKLKIFSQLYFFYLKHILPFLVGVLSPAPVAAYRYLANSILAFPEPEEILNLINKAGFIKVKHQMLTLGVVSFYTAEKPSNENQ